MSKTHLSLINWSLLITLLISPRLSLAEKITVKKVKGNQAVVESTTPLEEGQTYEIGQENISEDVDYKSNVLKTRDNSFTIGTQFSFLKSDTFQATNYSLQLRYGWNFGSLEVGGLLSGEASDVGAGVTSTIGGGAYLDYNFVVNRDPKKVIWGPFALVNFGSTQYPAATTGGSSNQLEANVGAFLTYFLGNSSTALRAEGYYIHQQVSTSAVQSTVPGGGFRGLLVLYF